MRDSSLPHPKCFEGAAAIRPHALEQRVLRDGNKQAGS